MNSNDVRGMIAVDKIGCRILFINPQSYETETVHSTDNALLRQGAYGLLNVGVIWRLDERLSFSLQGSNLTDEAYRTGGGFVFGALTTTYGPPRQVSLSARYEF